MSRHSRWRSGLCLLTVLCGISQPAEAAKDIAASVAEHLEQGRLAEAEALLDKQLADDPKHQQARFALGIVHVLSALEELGQDQYRCGALSNTVRNIPVLRLPIPVNPHPEEITYAQVRQVFVTFQRRMLQAETELARVDVAQDIKLPLDLAAIRLDLTGDGELDEQETFLQIFGVANRRAPGQAAPDMRVTFDSGDVPWLRGYCHFLAGFCDIVLAYDHQRLFDHCGQLVYPRHVPSEQIEGSLGDKDQRLEIQIVDFIAAIHLMNFPLKEPERMKAARKHFLEMIRTSRESWALIFQEDDNDHEWLPNPDQTGVLRVPVTREMIDGWHGVLTEMEDLLEGRKLVPFWRDYASWFGPNRPIPDQGRGINLKRYFDEPRDFDLILAIQGTGMLPYLEEGPFSRPETWNNLGGVFRGRFFGFAMWFN